MANPILTAAIDAAASGVDLSAEQAGDLLTEVMEGRSSDAETAAILIALRTKGETVDELVGLARTMRRLASSVASSRLDLIDTAGTGGGASTFNISTTAALIAAGAGCAVAKHGNRSSTSKCGSADLLEALGVRIDLSGVQVGQCIDRIGFGFMFAPAHHTAMRHVVPVRRQLAVRTIFNFLGPLTNPAGARRQVIGVSDRRFQATVAEALAELGCEHALVVSSSDGLDEFSIEAPSELFEVRGGDVKGSSFDPASLGVAIEAGSVAAAIAGGEPAENAALTASILDGAPGPGREVAALNAGAAIYVAGRAGSLEAGYGAALAAIDGGAARRVLDQLVSVSREMANSG